MGLPDMNEPASIGSGVYIIPIYDSSGSNLKIRYSYEDYKILQHISVSTFSVNRHYDMTVIF